MKPPVPDRITPTQWLAVTVIWAAVAWGLLVPAVREPDVRFAQASLACAQP